jgi:flagellar biosynthetic protein FlhB
MAEEDPEDRKHEPGGRQLEEALARGKIARSPDLGTAAVLAAGLAVFLYAPGSLGRVLSTVFSQSLHRPHQGLETLGDGMAMVQDLALLLLGGLAFPLGAIGLAALAVGLAQTRGQLAPRAIEVDFDRLDVVANFQNIFQGTAPWVDLAKTLAKVAVAAAVAWMAVRHDVDSLPRLAASPVGEQVRAVVWLLSQLLLYLVPVIVVLAVGDYAIAWWRTYRSLMRTDEQLKQEQKESEGEPRMKAQRRARQRQITFGGGLRRVAEADVVVTNPTHYAVALRYDREKDRAPVVVAKGVDHLALKIREEARRHDVPRIEDRALARRLYDGVQLGQPIPEELFGPVARVLAIVVRRRGRRRRKSAPVPARS